MPSLIAVDIGNTRIKLGQFAAPGVSSALGSPHSLPAPSRALAMPTEGWNPQELQHWLADVPAGTPWWIASVNRPAAAKLSAWIAERWPKRMLADTDLPITAAVEHPERVGSDRLAGAVAANRLREPARAAIIVSVGSAITVDLVTADGMFRGGAILPGIALSARAARSIHGFAAAESAERTGGCAAGARHFHAVGHSQRIVLGRGGGHSRINRPLE